MPTCYSRDGAGGVTYNNWEFPLGHGGEVIYRIAADPDARFGCTVKGQKSLAIPGVRTRARWRGVGFAGDLYVEDKEKHSSE